MKKILLSFSFCIYALLCVAQNQYKITYKGTLLSSSLNARLEQEVNDPVFLQGYKDLIEGFEVQYALYVDVSKGDQSSWNRKKLDWMVLPHSNIYSLFMIRPVTYILKIYSAVSNLRCETRRQYYNGM